MRVELQAQKTDVFVGDMIIFDKKPCMVIEINKCPNEYGVLSLDENTGGEVIAKFTTLSSIDYNQRTERIIIKNSDIVISKKGSVDECPL